MDRRKFLRVTAGAAASVGATGGIGACTPRLEGGERWLDVRALFPIDDQKIHLSGMLLAPHPVPVANAVARHREALDLDPAGYVEERDGELKDRARRTAARYMGVEKEDVALTDSTTTGIGLVYAGVQVRSGQELLTTDQDYSATHRALEFRSLRNGAPIRQLRLFDGMGSPNPDAIVDRIISAVNDSTRVLALTWVHSGTGLKLPVKALAERLEEQNRDRSPADRALLCLDGVHGFGVEDEDISDLGCDFFFAGTHKWIFAPRGTGVLWGRPAVQDQVRPTIPTFIRDGSWGARLSPGGFKAFEHQWSMPEAFAFHDAVGGRAEIQGRIHALATQLKEGLAAMNGVVVHTPLERELSSGIVCFDVDGTSPEEVVERLSERRIVASVTPYARQHARFSPGLMNTDEEIERALTAVRGLL